jgi:hypothetical protein
MRLAARRVPLRFAGDANSKARIAFCAPAGTESWPACFVSGRDAPVAANLERVPRTPAVMSELIRCSLANENGAAAACVRTGSLLLPLAGSLAPPTKGVTTRAR